MSCSASQIGAANRHAAHSNRRRDRSALSKAGWSSVSADLNVSVGDEASTLEDLMVEIRVAVADAAGAHGLLRRLAGLFALQLQTLSELLQLSLVTTGVGAVMIRPGPRRALLQSRRGACSCPPCARLIYSRV